MEKTYIILLIAFALAMGGSMFLIFREAIKQILKAHEKELAYHEKAFHLEYNYKQRMLAEMRAEIKILVSTEHSKTDKDIITLKWQKIIRSDNLSKQFMENSLAKVNSEEQTKKGDKT